MSVLLVQIEIRNNNNFRLALRTEYNDGKPHDKIYFEHLTDLRITRNEWFHRIINPITSEELFDLSKTITEVFPPHSQIAIKAKKLYDLLSSDEFTAVDLLRTSRYVGSYVSKLEEIQEIMIETHIEQQTAIMEEIMHQEIERETRNGSYVPSIGDPYTGSLLPQKYTLRLDGTIIDRREGLELKDKLGERAIEIGRSFFRASSNRWTLAFIGRWNCSGIRR